MSRTLEFRSEQVQGRIEIVFNCRGGFSMFICVRFREQRAERSIGIEFSHVLRLHSNARYLCFSPCDTNYFTTHVIYKTVHLDWER